MVVANDMGDQTVGLCGFSIDGTNGVTQLADGSVWRPLTMISHHVITIERR